MEDLLIFLDLPLKERAHADCVHACLCVCG